MKSKIETIDIDFHQLIENSLNAILILGEEGKIHYCNNAALHLLQVSSAELLLNNSLYKFIPDSIKFMCKTRLRKVLEKKEILACFEAQMIRVDEEIIDVEVRTAPLLLEEHVFAQIVIQDITGRKKAESLLRDREKLASLGQLAASIVHEVKNPLTTVKGFLQLIKENHSHTYLDTMESELERALEILQNLLQVSKPDLNDEPLVPINLCKELNSLLFLFQEKPNTVTTELSYQNTDRNVIGKRNLLIKALFNVLKNAIEAIPDKGTVKIHHYYENEFIHLKVSDTGVGLSKEHIKMLGTPFFSMKSHGTGLGLTQVYTAIHELGGNVCVESELGKGTTFHIQLPAS